MKIICTNALSRAQFKAIDNLMETYEDCDIFYSLDELSFDGYYLAYDSDTLVSFLSIMNLYGSYEITAFTIPSHRRRGLFSKLLQAAHKANPTLKLIGIIDDNSVLSNTRYTVHHAKNDYYLSIDKAHMSAPFIRGNNQHYRCLKRSFGLKYTFSLGNEIIGVANINLGNEYHTLWGVEIKEPHRRLGYGSTLIKYVLNDYFKKYDSALFLHVEGDNTAACKLYDSCGFYIIHTIPYYEL